MYLVKPIIKKIKGSSFFGNVYKILFYWSLRCLFFTYRLEVVYAPGVKDHLNDHTGIFYFWHQQIIAGMFFFFKMNAQGSCVVSPSSDGKIAGFICQKLGFNVLYGSAHKSSISVTRQALMELSLKGSLCLVGDGSRGPAFQLQKGLMYLSQKSGKPLVFVDCKPKCAFTFIKSWDQFQVPLPFSKIVVTLHQPEYPTHQEHA